jgi:hypothetical protein
MHGRVNHVTAEEAQGDKDVVLGTLLINTVPATVLFDSGASHSFITERFVTKHDVPRSSMKTHLLISSPNGEMKSTYVCPQVNLKIREIDFEADLVIITSSGIDVILGMDWFGRHDGIILCAKKSVLLTRPARTKDRVCCYCKPKEEGKVNQDTWMLFKTCANISISFRDHHVLESPFAFPIPPNLGTRFS